MDGGSDYIQDVWYAARAMDGGSDYIQDVWYAARAMDGGSGDINKKSGREEYGFASR